MGGRKRRLLIAASILLPLIVIVCFWAFYDAPPPDDADLRITYEPIPDDQNAFTYFSRAAEKVAWLEDREESRRIDDLLKEDGWDDTLAADILEQSAGLFDAIEEGLRCSRYQVPEIKDYGALLPYLVPCRRIAKLGVIRSELLLRSGRDREAFDQIIQIVRFGHRIQQGRGVLVNYLVGTSVKAIGLKQLRSMLGRTALASDELRPYIALLGAHGADEHGFTDALKVEYRCIVTAVDDMKSGKYWLSDLSMEYETARFMLLKANMTKRLFAGDIRALSGNASKPWVHAQRPDITTGNRATFLVKAFISGNGAGIIMHRMIMPNIVRAYASKCEENCVVGSTRVLIALRCYQLDHGELPDTLEALVPDYLDAVPLDDFDGKPMRYSKEKKVVYAVGTDLADNGGTAWNERKDVCAKDGYDIVYKTSF